jgi:hypothetical protein
MIYSLHTECEVSPWGVEMLQIDLIAIIVVLLGVLLRVKEPMVVGRMLLASA